MKLPIISLAILGVQAAVANASAGDIAGKVNAFQRMYTGVDFVAGSFQPTYLLFGYGPWLAKRFIMPVAHVRIPSSMHLPVSLS
jgi:hypothetical protein